MFLVMRGYIALLWLFLFTTLVSPEAFSRQKLDLQVLHTNDLHGFHEHTVFGPDVGGYAALKHKIDSLKSSAKAQNIANLTLDAGDFMEGSIFYMADQGQFNLRMMSAMGYDAVALGNHDWLMGTQHLANLLQSEPMSFDLLCANLKLPKIKGLSKITPYVIKQVGEYKIAIVGLTTDEMYYKWRFQNVTIQDPIKVAKKLAKKLKKEEKVDFIIAVTHLGTVADVELAKEVKELDLIVGGHSHTEIPEPLYIKANDSFKRIPIVQAGEHAKLLGQLVLELSPNRLKVKHYQLHPILHAEGQDQTILHLVNEGRNKVNDIYGPSYLEKHVGKTEIDLISSEHEVTVMNALIADAMRESLAADFSVHSAGFAGVDIPVGDISQEKIMQAYPRYFDMEELYGWKLYKVNVKGLMVRFLLNAFLSRPNGMTFSGITFDIDRKHKMKIAKNIKINGRPLSMAANYTVALPEGAVKGGLGITSFMRYILQSIAKSSIPMWTAIENKVAKLGTISANDGNLMLNSTQVVREIDPSEEKSVEKSMIQTNSARYLFVPKN